MGADDVEGRAVRHVGDDVEVPLEAPRARGLEEEQIDTRVGTADNAVVRSELGDEGLIGVTWSRGSSLDVSRCEG